MALVVENGEQCEIDIKLARKLVRQGIIYWCPLCNEYHIHDGKIGDFNESI
jgi:hypothetical protein